MSIINQTLRELDARAANATAAASVPLHPAAKPHTGKPWLRAGGVAGALLLAIGLGFALKPDISVSSKKQGDRTSPDRPSSKSPDAAGSFPVRSVPEPAKIPKQAENPSPSYPSAVMASPQLKTPTLSVRTAAGADSGQTRKPPAASRTEAAPSLHLSLHMEEAAKTTAAAVPAIRKEARNQTAEEEAEDNYRRAQSLIQSGRENLARPLLEAVLRRVPSHVPARQTLATLLSEAGMNLQAETVLREGRTFHPDNAWFSQSLARLQAARGDTEAAIATLQDGLGGRSVNADYHAMLGGLLVRLDRHGEAVRHYGRALESRPDQGTWWMGLGIALDAQGKKDEARKAYSRALSTGNLPDNLVAFVRGKLGD